MKRTIAVVATLALSALVAGCTDDEDGPDKAGDDASSQEAYSRGASVDDFCAALQEIDEAIDDGLEAQEGGTGADDDWQRVVASFDALDETGVPDDLSDDGVAELSQVEDLVRSSSSLTEFSAAVEKSGPTGGAVDDYIGEHCR